MEKTLSFIAGVVSTQFHVINDNVLKVVHEIIIIRVKNI